MENKFLCIVQFSASERNNLNLAADGAECLFLERIVVKNYFRVSLRILFKTLQRWCLLI